MLEPKEKELFRVEEAQKVFEDKKSSENPEAEEAQKALEALRYVIATRLGINPYELQISEIVPKSGNFIVVRKDGQYAVCKLKIGDWAKAEPIDPTEFKL